VKTRREDAVIREVGTHGVTVDSSAPTPSLLLLRYSTPDDHRLLVVNLADDHCSWMNDPLFAPPPGRRWTQLWSSEQPAYGGCGALQITDSDPWVFSTASAVLLASAAA
jgi:maltooligosyltrehalose trehalohydrolase